MVLGDWFPSKKKLPIFMVSVPIVGYRGRRSKILSTVKLGENLSQDFFLRKSKDDEVHGLPAREAR